MATIDKTPKKIFFGKDAKINLLRGAEILYKAVSATLGARGRHVLIDQSAKNRPVHVTKDGVTVANNVHLPNLYENTGAEMLRTAAKKTVEKAGDGTTTATVLAFEMLKRGMSLVDSGINPVSLVEGLRTAKHFISKTLKESAREAKNEEVVRHVANISCNNDAHLAELVTATMMRVGAEGAVSVKETDEENMIEFSEGYSLPCGYKRVSSMFTNSNRNMWVDARVRVFTLEIGLNNEDLFQKILADDAPTVIVAKDFSQQIVKTLETEYRIGNRNVCLVKVTRTGKYRRGFLDDVAAVCGSTVVEKEEEDILNSYGMSGEVHISPSETVFVDGLGMIESENAAYARFVNHVKNVETTLNKLPKKEDIDIRHYRNRLANLNSTSATIYIFAETEEEFREIADRADDGINAVRCALRAGIIPGAGKALADAGAKLKKRLNDFSKHVEPDVLAGFRLMTDVCSAPLVKIMENAGEELLQHASHIFSDPVAGYDVKKREIVDDLFEAGIVDPLDVTLTALSSATSTVAIMLTTEVTINFFVNDENGQDKDGVVYTGNGNAGHQPNPFGDS